MSANEFFGMVRMAAATTKNDQGSSTYGELTVYDPKTHMGKFICPLHRDLETDEPIETGWIAIESPFHGMQFPPPQTGMQARVHFLDARGLHAISATMLYNDVDTVPYPNGDTWGWRDPSGNEFKGTKDGWVVSSPSGFNIQATEQGKKITITTPGGLEISVSDNAGTISLAGDALNVSQDGLVRITDLQNALNTLVSTLQTWANANFQGGTNGAPKPQAPTATGSTKVASA